jgi:hypothetical protein
MKLLEQFLPLLGVLVGAAITGFAAMWKARVERKKVIARALSDLLEVRHQIVSVEAVIRELRKRVDLPDEAIVALRALARNVLPLEKDLHGRYSEAVSVLASIDPLLAFEMRSKDKAPKLFELTAVSATSGMSTNELSSLESTLQSVVGSSIDEAVIELANHHSWSTKRRVRALVSRGVEPPEELFSLLESTKGSSAAPAG